MHGEGKQKGTKEIRRCIYTQAFLEPSNIELLRSPGETTSTFLYKHWTPPESVKINYPRHAINIGLLRSPGRLIVPDML
jgi:hypothetical protein